MVTRTELYRMAFIYERSVIRRSFRTDDMSADVALFILDTNYDLEDWK